MYYHENIIHSLCIQTKVFNLKIYTFCIIKMPFLHAKTPVFLTFIRKNFNFHFLIKTKLNEFLTLNFTPNNKFNPKINAKNAKFRPISMNS